MPKTKKPKIPPKPKRQIAPVPLASDLDYRIEDVRGCGKRAWIEVGPFAIHIVKTDEGVVVDVYASGHEMDDPLTSCWALDSEADFSLREPSYLR